MLLYFYTNLKRKLHEEQCRDPNKPVPSSSPDVFVHRFTLPYLYLEVRNDIFVRECQYYLPSRTLKRFYSSSAPSRNPDTCRWKLHSAT